MSFYIFVNNDLITIHNTVKDSIGGGEAQAQAEGTLFTFYK
jgi:hypothetical protein